MRVLVAWCPDWSVTAGLREAERPADGAGRGPGRHVVEVCNGRPGPRGPPRSAAP